jgi:WD40 repeat protein
MRYSSEAKASFVEKKEGPIMRIGKRLSALLVLGLTVGSSAITLDPLRSEENKSVQRSPPADAKAIDKWIAQLGADSFKKREEAIQQLIAIGEPALTQLQQTVDNKDADPDVRLRAGRALRAIQSIAIQQVRCLGVHKKLNAVWATRLALTAEGKQAVTAGFDALHCWDLSSGKESRVFGANRAGYWSLAVADDGKRVLAGGADNNAYVFDAKTGELLRKLTGHTAPVWGAVWTADGKQALTGAWDGSIRVWDGDSGKELRRFKGVRDNVRCLALSPDGKLLAAGHFSAVNQAGTIRLWNLEKGTEARALPGHTMEVTSLAFSADGKMLVSSSFDRTLRLWSVADGKEVKRLEGHRQRIEGAAFTPDGRRVVSCGAEEDPAVRLWDVSSGKQLGESESVEGGFLSIAVLPDGRQALTTGKDGGVRLWRWAR